MISLKDSSGNKYNFTLSKFPDNTTQAWLITPEPAKRTEMEVLWLFESEAELMTVLQLGTLLYTLYCFPTLSMPYLVGGRQDKQVSNSSTFARQVTISAIINAGYTKIKTYDGHSSDIFIESRPPTELINRALQDKYDVICFPDKGAALRYADLLDPEGLVVVCDKVRNQLTGEIEGLKFLELAGIVDLTGQSVLVIDDLVDGGKTFTEVAKLLKDAGATKLGLSASHGIFSKGKQILLDSGYDLVYTTNSLLKNIPGEQPIFSGWNTDGSIRQSKVIVVDILGE